MKNNPQHILIIRLSAMGDVAMTIPVIRALQQQHPDIKITVVSRPFFKPFFDTLSNITFFAIDLKNRHKGFLGLLRLFNDLKKENIEVVADLHNVLRSKIIRNLFALSGIKTAATNKGRSDKKALTRSKNKVFKPLKSMFERHCDTFRKLGFKLNLENPTFPGKVEISDKIVSIIDQNNNNYIGIAPFAQYNSKVYPIDLMQNVIVELAKNTNNTILLFGGGEKEIAILNSLKKEQENVIVVAGKLNLSQELALISQLKVMLSMDSGNAHIAAMLGIPVVTLWGATHPFAGFVPFNQPMENALVSDRVLYPLLPTSVYGNKKVEGYENVMRTIDPLTVITKVESFL